MASKSKYINYVAFVDNLKRLGDTELQEQIYLNKTKLRMCEQELRLRRNNLKKVHQQIKEFNDAKRTEHGTAEHSPVASK